MGIQYLFLDFENVQPASLGSLKPGHCRIKVFLGQNQSKLPLELSRALQPFGQDVEFIQISGNGPNAVDFHIAFYIGKLSGSGADASYTIVSKDTGFDPLIRHLKASGIACRRVAAIDGATKAASAKPTPAKSVQVNGSALPASQPKPVVPKKVAAPKSKPAKGVVITFLPEGNGPSSHPKPVAASTARVTEVVKRLKGLKAAKPARLKTLQSSVRSWFKPALSTEELAAVIQGLAQARKIKIDGAKVTYSLG